MKGNCDKAHTSRHLEIAWVGVEDGRWEKFALCDGEEGKRYCIREGWKKFLGGGS